MANPRTEIQWEPFYMPQASFLKDFDIRNTNTFCLDFADNDFLFSKGKFTSCNLEWTGNWDNTVTFSKTTIKNCSFLLDNLDMILEECHVIDCHFDGVSIIEIHLNRTTFSGYNVFDTRVVDRGGNIGFENVQFNDEVFDWE